MLLSTATSRAGKIVDRWAPSGAPNDPPSFPQAHGRATQASYLAVIRDRCGPARVTGRAAGRRPAKACPGAWTLTRGRRASWTLRRAQRARRAQCLTEHSVRFLLGSSTGPRAACAHARTLGDDTGPRSGRRAARTHGTGIRGRSGLVAPSASRRLTSASRSRVRRSRWTRFLPCTIVSRASHGAN